MRRPTIVSLLCAATFCLAGCGDDADPPQSPTPVQPVVESITGSINPFSARIHAFTVDNPGTVTINLTDITPDDPDDPTIVGVDLGTAIGTNACQVTVSNTEVTRGESITGTATSVGTLCVRVYDADPNGLPGPVTYLLTVTHF